VEQQAINLLPIREYSPWGTTVALSVSLPPSELLFPPVGLTPHLKALRDRRSASDPMDRFNNIATDILNSRREIMESTARRCGKCTPRDERSANKTTSASDYYLHQL